MSREGARLTVPSPLVGEGQGEGYKRHKACLQAEGWQEQSLSLMRVELAHRNNFARCALLPPLSLSLSLPHKGGGNDVALFRLTPPLHSRDDMHASVRNRL